MFNEWAELGLPERAIWKEFLVPIGRSVRNLGEKVEVAKSQAGVHAFLWRIEDFPTTFRSTHFARIFDGDSVVVDDDGVPYLAVSPQRFTEPRIQASACNFL